MTVIDLAIYLEQQGFGTRAIDIFAGGLPETPDDAIALIDVQGSGPEFVLNRSGINLDKPRVQVLVRSKDYEDAMIKSGNIFLDVSKIINTFVNGVRYLAITPMQSPFLLKRDEAHRPVMAFNIDIVKEP